MCVSTSMQMKMKIEKWKTVEKNDWDENNINKKKCRM